ncbi:MAG TPA: glycosyltransferase [Anaerohalosphaeraceae bacterium]|jgi:colanic acid/amylovoran biosynthesis glycosyltransferase|nr:glycosyltransferase [Anaerohalosphaeraceae bacterium]HRT51596.1 glycosyltransferase [Anaerohalosphaeraceae bacterium]HRT87612.1 glycosyltransferase [Anaerohalosphaeraceae bacterium]
MKIAIITTSFPSLSETFVLDQITGLLDLGHDVRIFAWRDPGESVEQREVAARRLRDRTCYIPTMPRHKMWRLLKAAALIVANFHKGPRPLLKFTGMFLHRRKGLSLAYLYFLLYFMENNFDVIHCHYGLNGLVGAFLKEAGIPGKVCTSFHGFDVSRYLLKNGPDVYRPLFSKGDLFMPVSEYWRDRLIELHCPADKIVVHHMGIDPRKFPFVERRLEAGEPLRLLTVGRLVEKKGHAYALRAVAKLVHEGRDIMYVIAGDGPERASLEGLCVQFGIRDKVQFAGALARDEVIKLYQASHVFLLPSVTASDGDTEGIPVVLMEASAMGMPVLASTHSGIPEIVIDGKSGFLVPERDVDALAAKLRVLHDNPHLWPSLGRHGRTTVEQMYDIKRLNQKLEDVYAALCASD